ncbi:DUF4381 domain-containing protein [Luteimonas sp. A478]
MIPGDALPLRDIHVPSVPGWWPPAPGWWLLALLVLAVAAVITVLLWRRVRRRRSLRRMFDSHVAIADTAPERIAAMSALLRRAVLERDPAAATLQGDAWLAYLERDPAILQLDGESRRMLLEGGYRRDLGDVDLQALHEAARDCFLRLAGGRK